MQIQVLLDAFQQLEAVQRRRSTERLNHSKDDKRESAAHINEVDESIADMPSQIMQGNGTMSLAGPILGGTASAASLIRPKDASSLEGLSVGLAESAQKDHLENLSFNPNFQQNATPSKQTIVHTKSLKAAKQNSLSILELHHASMILLMAQFIAVIYNPTTFEPGTQSVAYMEQSLSQTPQGDDNNQI